MLRSRFSLRALLLTACICFAAAVHADDLADVQRLYYAGQASNAMERADKFLAQHSKDPQMRFMKGVMLADARRNAEAIGLFQKLSEDYPDLAEPYNNLAALYAAAGDYAKARATLEQALRTNPGYATAHENLGDIYAALAAQSYGRALKLDPSNVTVPPKLALMRELYKRPGIGAPTALPGEPRLPAAPDSTATSAPASAPAKLPSSP